MPLLLEGVTTPALPPVPLFYPPRHVFRFLAENIVTGVLTTQDLALEEWAYEELLNRPGSLTGKVPLTALDATEEVLDPWRTAIYVERDGRIEWGGILTPPQLGVAETALSIACLGWSGYWDRRTIRTTYTAVGVDQFEIVAQLLADAQDEGINGDGYDLGIAVDWDALSGRLRDRTYSDFDAKNLGEALRQLAAVLDGFDFAMTYQLNATTNRVDKAVKLYYPTKGRVTNYLFEYERDARTNVIARGFTDPVNFAWTGDGWGSGNDATRLRSRYIDETLRGVYPPFDAAPTFSSVTVQETLDEDTAGTFARTNRPKRIPLLRVDPDAYPLWSDHELGDTVNVTISDGYGSTPSPQRFRETGRHVTFEGVYDVALGDPLGDVPAEDT